MSRRGTGGFGVDRRSVARARRLHHGYDDFVSGGVRINTHEGHHVTRHQMADLGANAADSNERF